MSYNVFRGRGLSVVRNQLKVNLGLSHGLKQASVFNNIIVRNVSTYISFNYLIN